MVAVEKRRGRCPTVGDSSPQIVTTITEKATGPPVLEARPGALSRPVGSGRCATSNSAATGRRCRTHSAPPLCADLPSWCARAQFSARRRRSRSCNARPGAPRRRISRSSARRRATRRRMATATASSSASACVVCGPRRSMRQLRMPNKHARRPCAATFKLAAVSASERMHMRVYNDTYLSMPCACGCADAHTSVAHICV